METFSVLLVLCAGNSPVTGEFPSQRPLTRNFDVFFDLHLNKRLNKQSWGWWFQTPSRPSWRQCNALLIVPRLLAWPGCQTIMAWIIQEKRVFVFREERFQIPAPHWCWKFDRKYKYIFYIIQNKFSRSRVDITFPCCCFPSTLVTCELCALWISVPVNRSRKSTYRKHHSDLAPTCSCWCPGANDTQASVVTAVDTSHGIIRYIEFIRDHKE